MFVRPPPCCLPRNHATCASLLHASLSFTICSQQSEMGRIAERFLSGGTGWQLVSSSDVYQTDGHNCGVWLQVARDCWLQYAASSSYGSCNFFAFMQAQLVEHGVSDVESLPAAKKRAGERANRAYIVSQRADMRGRLVQAAMQGVLKHSAAQLAGFTQTNTIDLDLDSLDDEA